VPQRGRNRPWPVRVAVVQRSAACFLIVSARPAKRAICCSSSIHAPIKPITIAPPARCCSPRRATSWPSPITLVLKKSPRRRGHQRQRRRCLCRRTGRGEAQVLAAKANLETYRVTLEFTRITAPVTGRIGRNYLTIGNLVTKDETLLTTIVSENPMYAYFDMDSRTAQRAQDLARQREDSAGQG